MFAVLGRRPVATSTRSVSIFSPVLSVAVAYPPDPCDAATRATVVLSAQLAPASYAPRTQLPSAIADPAAQ